ncbi:MAG: glycosyltransferase [Planctomycetaceae bacterium]|jgi:glycosyltransferase involved in cell wall biosynthesis|nr:glycosyltransferase [Planctomycetaceae bacterium]
MNKKISVIVPVYNTEKYLEKCVDSIIQQSYENIEVLLIDDGSTDSCVSICDRYADQDKRVKVIHQANAGVAASRNKGIENASGEYVAFVDSDDFIRPETFAKLHEELTKNKADLAILNEIIISPESGYEISYPDPIQRPFKLTGCFPAKDFWLECLDTCPHCASLVVGKLCKRSVLDNIRFGIENRYADISFLAQWFLACEKVVFVLGEYYFYTLRFGNEFSKKYKQWTPQRLCECIDIIINKINLFYEKGLTDAAYSYDRFFIQSMLRHCEDILAWTSNEERKKWLPELKKRSQWFKEQIWTIHNGKTYWTKK